MENLSKSIKDKGFAKVMAKSNPVPTSKANPSGNFAARMLAARQAAAAKRGSVTKK